MVYLFETSGAIVKRAMAVSITYQCRRSGWRVRPCQRSARYLKRHFGIMDGKDKLDPGADFMLLPNSVVVNIAQFHQSFTKHLFDLTVNLVMAERSHTTRHSRWKLVDAVTKQAGATVSQALESFFVGLEENRISVRPVVHIFWIGPDECRQSPWASGCEFLGRLVNLDPKIRQYAKHHGGRSAEQLVQACRPSGHQ